MQLVASDEQACYASETVHSISLVSQEQYCLTRAHRHCPIFERAKPPLSEEKSVLFPPALLAAATPDDADESDGVTRRQSRPVLVDRLVMIVVAAVVLFAIAYFGLLVFNQLPNNSSSNGRPVAVAATSTPTPSRTATTTETPRPTLAATPTRITLPPPTPPAGGQLLTLNPTLSDVGWVASNERTRNHLGDSLIRVGVLDRATYLGFLQFDLSGIPAGTKVAFASLDLTGVSEEWLGDAGTWQVKMVRGATTKSSSLLTYDDIQGLPWDYILLPTLSRADLGKDRVNRFEIRGPTLSSMQRQFGQGKVAFRLEGPTTGVNNLFAWDAGFGADDLGNRPVLNIGIEAPVAVSTSAATRAAAAAMVIVPCVPTPASKSAQAALAATATYVATTVGTATPYPPNYVTPVVVTPISTQQAIFSAATRVAQATLGIESPTPTPANWVQPFIVTNTPLPGNQATAVYESALATAVAATTGTPTPFPCNYWTATPAPPPTITPVVNYAVPSASPTATATPTPSAIPPILRGKIVFQSDRDGTPAIYVMDPDGTHIGVLTNRWAYDATIAQVPMGGGGLYQVIVQGNLSIGTKIAVITANKPPPRIIFENNSINYDPAFAPDGYNLVFVSTVTGADEIYRINRDGGGFAQVTTGSTWQWNKKPSWSPDGKSIIWWSNRETGRKQIWIMNADGSNPRNLSNNAYNDWDPVWVR